MEIFRKVSDAGQCSIMLLGLEGWPDAARAASTAVEYLLAKAKGELIYKADSDIIYNYTVARPHVEISDAVIRKLVYPTLEIYRLTLSNTSMLICRGHEPHRIWIKLLEELMSIIEAHSVNLVVTFGSMLDDVPEVKISAVVSSESEIESIRSLGIDLVRYSGPCSFYTPLVHKCSERGLRCISLWAHVPLVDYYEVLARYNLVDWRATAALLEKFTHIANIEIDLSEVYQRANEVELLVRRLRSGGESSELSKYLL